VSSGKGSGKIVRDVKVVNKLGFHARPAATFAKVASQFDSDITVVMDDRTVSGKSLMGLLSLAAACGTTIRIIAEGVDALEAVDSLDDLVTNRLEEDAKF
jgi:phosphocarrier protein HPr